MLKESSRLSRRRYVERSALTAGVLGAAGLAGTKGDGAEAGEAPTLTATSAVNARQHGARGDGQTDDTRALQAALDAARTKGPDLLGAGRTLSPGWAVDRAGRGHIVRRVGRSTP